MDVEVRVLFWAPIFSKIALKNNNLGINVFGQTTLQPTFGSSSLLLAERLI